jgi:hypothetical protein
MLDTWTLAVLAPMESLSAISGVGATGGDEFQNLALPWRESELLGRRRRRSLEPEVDVGASCERADVVAEGHGTELVRVGVRVA